MNLKGPISLQETARSKGFSEDQINSYENNRALCHAINTSANAEKSFIFKPKQLVLIGFGMVGRTLMTILLKTQSRLLQLPIVIIEPKKIVAHNKTKDSKSQEEFPSACKYDSTTDEHEPEIIYSEIFAKLCAITTVTVIQKALNLENYKDIFEKNVNNNAIVVELAVRINTASLLQECQRKNCLYVNTAIDCWKHNNDSLFSVKQAILEKVKYETAQKKMTAVLNHGMNPGLVSHFVKYLLKSLASKDKRLAEFATRKKYNLIAKALGLTLIQIAERDTQTSVYLSSEKCFFNTWSVVGFIDEATLPTEISWGTHEKKLPQHAFVKDRNVSTQIILPVPGYQVRTQSYEPKGGIFTGYCIPHAEAYSIANYLRVGNIYNPSVYYSYLVPDTAKLITHYLDYSLNKQYLPKREHVLQSDEIKNGYDSVGILAFFRQPDGKLKKYWVGSIVDNEFAKKLSPEINCTCAQVAISVIACIEWMLLNPHKGILEPEEIDSEFIIDMCKDWLGEFYMKDVTNDCKIDSDQLSNLLASPMHIFFD